MSSLTVAAALTKKIFAFAAIGVGALIVLLIALGLLGRVKNALFPPAADPALVAFGKLPPVKLEEGVTPPGVVTYKIDTVSGDLKDIKSKLKVFAIGSADLKFGDPARANGWAKAAGFRVPPVEAGATTATYVDTSDKTKTLQVDIVPGNFVVNSDYLNDPEVISYQVKDEEAAKSTAQAFLRSFGVGAETYPTEKIELLKFRVDGGRLSEALSLSKTNIEQVNFYHMDLDTIPVVYPTFQKAKVRLLVSKGEVIAAKANFADILNYKFSTYPLLSIKEAFSDLKAGKAIYNKALLGDVFSIRDVKLAYLDTEGAQEYLQPVYDFVSNEGLAAYVPAVSKAWIEN